jgi:hypothetical protein
MRGHGQQEGRQEGAAQDDAYPHTAVLTVVQTATAEDAYIR